MGLGVGTDYRQTFLYGSLPPELQSMEVKKGRDGWREEGRKWRGGAGCVLVEMRSLRMRISSAGVMSEGEGEIS